MSAKPAAELAVGSGIARRLLRQAADAVPGVADLPLHSVASGWDCDVWRLGADLAMRLPRRALAAPLIRHEAQALPVIAPAIQSTGIRVPLPVFVGEPSAEYPWPWSVVPYIDGMPGISIARAERTSWAEPLARALRALHVDAPVDHPVNPVRGVPLARRADAVAARFRDLPALSGAEEIWQRGVAAPPWRAAPVWIHGDLHPGNLIASGDGLRGIIDFGDVTGGDPAYDLAVAWLAFDTRGRELFIAATDRRYDSETWVRAHAWAAAVAVLLLSQSDDDPPYRLLAVETLNEIAR
ncbi:aminoglycoside phosphotransferase family protein [Planococcus sp. APC 4015]|nr:aminoglycoside phosphotransferase family protein [Planococcus sp. APC 4015]